MKKRFSTEWKGSKQPRKQRKFKHNAPLHIKGGFLSVHLSKELAEKYGIRRMRIRVGDKAKVMRGEFKKKESKVELVDLKTSKVTLAGIEIAKKDGSKSRPRIHASNLLITELNLDDKKRLDKSKDKQKKQRKMENTSQSEIRKD
nr:50S ribosomal protein L24, large subunit ribosomal protein L24 [uncultured archaeon]